MRCKFCGSPSLHADKQHKTFSAGKAVAGAVTFGAVGAAAGFIGKEKNGYRCGACGSFMDAPMDSFTEMQLDGAIRDAEAGRGRSMYDYYKRQYPNIQANIPAELPTAPAAQAELPADPAAIPPEANTDTIKRSYRPARWQSGCPIWIEDVIIKTRDNEDRLALIAWNQSEKTIRSAYYLAKVLDDTGDEVASCRCVYQGLSVPPTAGDESRLPLKKDFPLGTDLAYRVELTCEKVAFDGDEVWRAEDAGEEHALHEQVLLTKENFPRIQYVASRYAKMRRSQARRDSVPYVPEFYMPEELDGLWLCDCGHPAEKGGRCPYCGDSLDEVREAFGQQRLREIQLDAVKERAAKRAKATQALYDEAFAKREREETSRKERLYAEAEGRLKKDTIEDVVAAIGKYQELGDWKDAKEKYEFCKRRVKELRDEKAAKDERDRQERERKEEEARIAAEAKAKKTKKTLIIAAAVLALCMTAALVFTKVILPGKRYNEAVSLLEAGRYEEAIAAFRAMDGYKDSNNQLKIALDGKAEQENANNYQKGEELIAAGDYRMAITVFQNLGDYRDSRERAEEAIRLRDEEEQQRLAGWRSEQSKSSRISGGNWFALGVRSDGTAVAAGYNQYNQCDVSGWTDLVAVSAGATHSVGLRSDGTAVAAGYNGDGRCDVSGWHDLLAVSAGGTHTVGLMADGTAVATGRNSEGQCDVSAWHDLVAVSACASYTIGLRADGTVVAVGKDNYGELKASFWSNIKAISSGTWHTVGLRSDGTVKAAGYNKDGRCDVASWNNIVAVSAGGYHTVGLRSDGTVVAVGRNVEGQCDVSSWTDVVAVAAGDMFTLGLRSDGNILAAGENGQGQLDAVKWTDIMLP